jgi:hypothetical protein
MIFQAQGQTPPSTADPYANNVLRFYQGLLGRQRLCCFGVQEFSGSNPMRMREK